MKLLDQVRTRLRVQHYAYATEKSYCHWIRRYIIFNKKRHPAEMGAEEVANFLSYLAVKEHVSASTQKQALCGILFLYRQVPGIDLGDLETISFSTVSRRLPTVLSKAQVSSLLSSMEGVYATMATLLYGAGLRQNEGLRLRVADISFDRKELVVRCGKGNKDRITMLPVGSIAGRQAAIASSNRTVPLLVP